MWFVAIGVLGLKGIAPEFPAHNVGTAFGQGNLVSAVRPGRPGKPGRDEASDPDDDDARSGRPIERRRKCRRVDLQTAIS